MGATSSGKLLWIINRNQQQLYLYLLMKLIILTLLCVMLFQANTIDRNLQVISFGSREGPGNDGRTEQPHSGQIQTIVDPPKTLNSNSPGESQRPDNATAQMNHTHDHQHSPNENDTYWNRSNQTHPHQNETKENRTNEVKPPKQPQPRDSNRRARREQLRERDSNDALPGVDGDSYWNRSNQTHPHQNETIENRTNEVKPPKQPQLRDSNRRARREQLRERDSNDALPGVDGDSSRHTSRTELPIVVTCLTTADCLAAFPKAKREIVCNTDAGVCVFA